MDNREALLLGFAEAFQVVALIFLLAPGPPVAFWKNSLSFYPPGACRANQRQFEPDCFSGLRVYALCSQGLSSGVLLRYIFVSHSTALDSIITRAVLL